MLGLLVFTAFLLLRNYRKHKGNVEESKRERDLQMVESSSVQGIIVESAYNVSMMVSKCNEIYLASVNGLAKLNAEELRIAKKDVVRLSKEIEKLRNELFYFIQEKDEESVAVSHFYINLISILEDMAQSLEYITKASHKHVSNNHRQLKYSQIKELKETQLDLDELFAEIRFTFDMTDFNAVSEILPKKEILFSNIDEKINQQVLRTRSKEEKSPKNTTLFFSLMIETKDLIVATFNLIELYYQKFDPKVAPRRVSEDQKDR